MSESSRLLRASTAVLAVALVCFVTNLIAPVLPWVLLWLPGVVGAAVLTAAFLRTSRAGHLPAPARRFWRHLAVAAVFVGAGHGAQAVSVLTGDTGASAGQMTIHAVALVVVLYALLRLPFGKQTGGELFRVVLDAGTVMLGCAVFVWHFVTRNSIASGSTGAVYTSLALTTAALVVVFALAKFTMASHVYVRAGTLRWISVAVFVGALGPALRPLVQLADGRLYPEMVHLPAIYLLVVWGTELQLRTDPGRRRGARPAPRRQFSVLPYVAVAAVDALLIRVTWAGGDPDERVVVASAVLLTGLVVVRQITAFRDNGRLLQRLDHSATHDALTQLPNRVLFHERLGTALAGSGRVAVALIDLDDFKVVNDTLGHEVGDALLITVAQRLGGCIRTEDTVARLGGDEFVVVLDGADPAAADLAARRMIDALRAPAVVDGHELPIRASIGIADGRGGDDPSVLLRRADIAMYAAKNVPGTASLHYDSGMAMHPEPAAAAGRS